MDDVYENIHDYSSSGKRKILIVFDDMIAGVMANKNFQAIIKELFLIYRKLIKTCFYCTILFFFSKRCSIKFNTLSNYENQ